MANRIISDQQTIMSASALLNKSYFSHYTQNDSIYFKTSKKIFVYNYYQFCLLLEMLFEIPGLAAATTRSIQGLVYIASIRIVIKGPVIYSVPPPLPWENLTPLSTCGPKKLKKIFSKINNRVGPNRVGPKQMFRLQHVCSTAHCGKMLHAIRILEIISSREIFRRFFPTKK